MKKNKWGAIASSSLLLGLFAGGVKADVPPTAEYFLYARNSRALTSYQNCEPVSANIFWWHRPPSFTAEGSYEIYLLVSSRSNTICGQTPWREVLCNENGYFSFSILDRSGLLDLRSRYLSGNVQGHLEYWYDITLSLCTKPDGSKWIYFDTYESDLGLELYTRFPQRCERLHVGHGEHTISCIAEFPINSLNRP